METKRQQKVARQIQKDVSEIFIKEAAPIVKGSMVSVTLVRMSSDLSFAKVYISVFPFANGGDIVKMLTLNASIIRNALGVRLKHQLRHIPEVAFYIDDSLEYVDNIEKLLKQ